MLLRRPFLWAVLLALRVSASGALSMPSPLSKDILSNPINMTESSKKARLGHLPNLTYAPWPALPFEIPLYPGFRFPHLIFINASPFRGTRPVSLPRLQEFLQEFGSNLEREYPPPGLVPRQIQQFTFDIHSYTKWSIEMNEGFLGFALPTEIALVALDEISRQLGIHGPSSLFFSIREGAASLSYGFLIISEFGSVSLNRSLANGNSVFRTN